MAVLYRREGQNPLFVTDVLLAEVLSIIKQLCSVMLCVAITVHKYDFMLVINTTSNKWPPFERWPYCDTDSRFRQDVYVCHRPSW